MKKHAIINPIKNLTTLFFLTILLFGCEKEEQHVQKFDDVFDRSGIKKLNQSIISANNIDEIRLLDNVTSFEIPANIKNISLDEMIAHYEENIKLSPTEVDLLLKNDSETFANVVDRFGKLPGQLSNQRTNFEKLESSSLEKFLLSQKSEVKNFYGGDCYSTIMDLQENITNDVIIPLKKLKDLSTTKDSNLKSLNYGYYYKTNVYKYITCHYCNCWWWIIYKYWLKHYGGSWSSS